jgi:hypothetical protein
MTTMTRQPTVSQQRFFTLLQRAPRLVPLWDEDNLCLRLEDFELVLGVMSSGEVVMAQFFVGVWFGSSERYPFDFVDGMSRIDSEQRAIVKDWVEDPFWL